MEYAVIAKSNAKVNAEVNVKSSTIPFGITTNLADSFPNPAELFLSAFSACILKNVERFSEFMKFEYAHAEVNVTAVRLEKPPRMDTLQYTLRIYSNDKSINSQLLLKNIEKFGTIYNTVKRSSEISGSIEIIEC